MLRFLFLAIAASTTVSAFTSRQVASPLSPLVRQQPPPQQSATVLFNVPPPAEGTKEYVAYANTQPPPGSFFELQQDCVRAVRLARQDGLALLEVEYPPLPAAVLEMDDVSSYQVLEANLRLAQDLAKGLLASSEEHAPKKVAILFPDEAELEFAVKYAGSATPFPGIQLEALRRSDPGDERIFKPEQLVLGLFGRGSGGTVKAIEDADVYICLTFSAQELPDLEELHEMDETKTLICFNLKLDTLRGDLGAPAFPSKDFHDRFLSRVKPVYYLRTRQYSRSTAKPPFLVNFQGCLFRAYPGQYQTLLDTGNGKYRRLQGRDLRPGLGEFKQQLIDALKEQGILQEESSALDFLRTGYKVTTWWEEERPSANEAWRT